MYSASTKYALSTNHRSKVYTKFVQSMQGFVTMKSITCSYPAVTVVFKTDSKPNSYLVFDSHTHGIVPGLTSAAKA